MVNKFIKRDKKGLAGTGLLVTILAIVGLIVVVMWVANLAKGFGSGLTVVVDDNGNTVSTAPTVNVPVEDVTVTFSSWDAYAKGTNAGSGHFIIQLGNDEAIQVNDDGTRTASPNDKYIVMVGNITTSLTANTNYYPIVLEGNIPNQGTFTIAAGQYLSGGASQVTFTFKNDVDQVNTAVALGANDNRVVKWIARAADNTCVGNPDTGKENLMSYTYNNTEFNKVQQLNANGGDQSAVSVPSSITAVTGKRTVSYTFPVFCDNAQIERDVRLETGATQPDGTDSNINMTVSDITWDRNADTLALISDVQDEDNNDIGVADFALAGLIVG
mgnify:CR=1 FL=1